MPLSLALFQRLSAYTPSPSLASARLTAATFRVLNNRPRNGVLPQSSTRKG